MRGRSVKNIGKRSFEIVPGCMLEVILVFFFFIHVRERATEKFNRYFEIVTDCLFLYSFFYTCEGKGRRKM